MDDGFLAWPNEENIHIFNQLINSLDPNLEFMFKPSIKYVDDNGTPLEKLNFLDIMVIKNEHGKIVTDIYYKETNNHKYLNYNSHHPTHKEQHSIYFG